MGVQSIAECPEEPDRSGQCRLVSPFPGGLRGPLKGRGRGVWGLGKCGEKHRPGIVSPITTQINTHIRTIKYCNLLYMQRDRSPHLT